MFSKVSAICHLYQLDMCAKSFQSWLALWDSVDCSPPGSSVHRILQARILECVAISFSRISSRPRYPNCLFCLPPASVGRFFTTSPTWEAPTEHKLPTIVFTFLITSLFFVNRVTCFIETFTYFANTFVLVSSPPPPEGFPGGTGAKNLPANAEDARNTDLILGSGRSPAVGNGNQLQYSCLENSTVRVLQDMSVVSQRVGDDWAHTHASQPASWQ